MPTARILDNAARALTDAELAMMRRAFGMMAGELVREGKDQMALFYASVLMTLEAEFQNRAELQLAVEEALHGDPSVGSILRPGDDPFS